MIELLSPAGSFESLRAAVQNGADAVYFGGSSFNARRRAKNFVDTELSAAVAYAHRFGVRVYITCNILVSDREMPEADEAVRLYARAGADALIVQDLGLARRIHAMAPEIVLHASTQCSIHNAEGARKMQELGFSRVVAARELSRDDIAAICKESPIGVEVFAHGALCAAYSGQCYMSAVIGRRSGNRGLCAQPCRLPYEANGERAAHIMSLKELCMARHLKEMDDLGVCSLKIEGRMRRPEYVACATAVYRKALDTGTVPDKEELRRLATLFSREGFTDGYYTGRAVSRTAKPGRLMFGTRTEAPEAEAASLNAAIRKTFDSDAHRKETPLRVKVAQIGEPEQDKYPPNRKSRPKLTVAVRTLDQITPELMQAAPVWVYVPLDAVSEAPERVRKLIADGVPIAAALPRVILPTQRDEVRKMLGIAAECGVKTVLCGNIGQIDFAREFGFEARGDFGLNAYNSGTLTVLREAGFVSATASFELRLAAIRDLGKPLPVEAIVYGRLPLMLFENCLIRSAEGVCRCGKPEGKLRPMRLKDRAGEEFICLPAYGCRTELFNAHPMWLADRREDYSKLGLNTVRLIFTTESPAECARVASCYLYGGDPPEKFTRGLYYRGVE